MRMRRMLGLALAAATLAGMSALGAVSAQATVASPTITSEECTTAGGQVTANPYREGYTCTLPDGSRQPIT